MRKISEFNEGENIGIGAREAWLPSQTMQKEVSFNRGCEKKEDLSL